MDKKKKQSCELLSPAGSLAALGAAIEGGADAVYLGGTAFNARINAKNFTEDELREGIELAHQYSARVYITANTQIYDREREDYLRAAERAYLLGADALIVADIGMAREIKKRIPIELHASTQLSGHNVGAARELFDAGFSRMVLAREMPREDIREFCRSSPIEAEVFVHGALCVSTSGQCLFSSLVGGRSGNRGECAQPCRLPYSSGRDRQGYPLSLCDLSLAEHICELRDMGVASFKIEGRMKSPEYVRDVTRIWRELLRDGRNATKEDMKHLERVFSRGGFTDGYYTGRVCSGMLGVRSESDKRNTAAAAEDKFEGIGRKIPVKLFAKIKRGEPATLSASALGRSAKATGAVPDEARNAPLTDEAVRRSLSKLGGTAYSLEALELELDAGLMLPVSALNALRREALAGLSPKIERREEDIADLPLESAASRRVPLLSATFYDVSALTDEAFDFFDLLFVPLEKYSDCHTTRGDKLGVLVPEVIFDSQRENVKELLRKAYKAGAQHALVGNIGHLALVREEGFTLHGDFRLNVTNRSSAAVLEEYGIADTVLSPELSLAQMRDIGGCTRAIIYGRIPLMLTEKCVGKELGGCERCRSGHSELVDRRGARFPVLRRFPHRSAVFNSVPTYMADKAAELRRYGLVGGHFVFSVEDSRTVNEIIRAYKQGLPPTSPVRRI